MNGLFTALVDFLSWDHANNLLTALLIVLATVVGVLALRQNMRATRRERTFDVLLTRFTGDYVARLHQ